MIRKFRENDIDEVMTLWLNSNKEAHSFVDSNYWEDNYQMVKELIPQADVYVYEADGNILGFAGVSENYIAGIFVDGNYRSQGIGKKLLDYLKEVYTELTLQVYEKNSRAVDFYKREGFEIEAEGIDDFTNEKELYMKWGE